MAKPFIFISYARADAQFVIGLAEKLRSVRVSLWLDQLDIRPGDPWEESIEKALEDCESVLLVLSPASMESVNVKDEVSYAIEEGKRIVPLLYQACKIPLRLRRLHYVDFTASFDAGMSALQKALEVDEVVIDPPVSSPVVTNPLQPKPAGKPHQHFTESLPGGVRLDMVAIPGGSFMMGSKTFGSSQPIHGVTLKPFFIGKYPVTQAQWKAVMGNNPSHFKGDDLPVERVSWDDAREFCRKLSQMAGKEYRLPSEAEWEFAARAGSPGDYCFGNDESLLPGYAWFERNSGGKTHSVGQKKPNNWGLHDVHGNVWEWCEDGWHDNYEGAPADGSAWVDGGDQSYRHLRGGSWGDSQDGARAVSRDYYDPNSRSFGIGFRVVSAVCPPSQ